MQLGLLVLATLGSWIGGACEVGLEERRIGRPGAHAVDADAFGPVVDRHRSRELHHGALRRAVGSRPRGGDETEL